MWKAFLYAEEVIEREPALQKWVREQNQGAGAIRCSKVCAPVNEQNIRRAAQEAGAELSECLLTVTRDSEWALAQELGLAALPYVLLDAGKQSFSGAWLVAEGLEEAGEVFFRRVYERYHRLPWTIFSTERCIVRELALSDLDALYELYAQKELQKYVEPLYPREEEMEYQRAYINNMYRYFGYGMWLVFTKDTNELIGRAGLEHREYPEGMELELGYLICPKKQRQGYAAEVCRAILDYAKKELGSQRINCLIAPDNAVSIHLAQKLGFVFLEETQITGKTMRRYCYNG